MICDPIFLHVINAGDPDGGMFHFRDPEQNPSGTELLIPAELAGCRKVVFPDFGITVQDAPRGMASDPEVADFLSALAAALTMHAMAEYPDQMAASSEETGVSSDGKESMLYHLRFYHLREKDSLPLSVNVQEHLVDRLQQQIFEELSRNWDKGGYIDLRPLFSQTQE